MNESLCIFEIESDLLKWDPIHLKESDHHKELDPSL